MKLWSLAGLSGLALLSACGSGGGVSAVDGGSDALSDGESAEDYVPIPKTSACTGDKTSCLSGTFALDHFTAKTTATKVTLYRLFPHGTVEVIAWTPVAQDGTFAFSNVAAWAHYYLQGEARFGTGSSATAIATNVGSFTVPATPATIPIVLRPVFLEVLQQALSGGTTYLDWASAHVYDPASGKEVMEGTVSLKVNGATYAMPYGVDVSGGESFNVNAKGGTPGGTSFTITTQYPELGASPVTWTLVGDPATFGGAITSPSTGKVPANTPLKVTWQAQPMASYSETELFEEQGSGYVQRYASTTVNAPDVTSETIPGSSVSSKGTYLLNEDYANATCPASADGCVYNVSSASATLTVE